MDEKDKQLLSNIISITSSLLDRVNELSELEAQDKKDTPKYHSLIESIKQTMMLEESLYDKLCTSFEKTIALSRSITNLRSSQPIGVTVSKAINGRYDELVKNRVNQNLMYRLNTKNKTMSDIIFEIDDAIVKDIVNTILRLLKDAIDDPRYGNIKGRLTRFKYSLAFIFNDTFKGLLDTNFDVSNDLYWISSFYQNLYGFNIRFFDQYRTGHNYDIINEVVIIFMDMLGCNLRIDDNYAKAIICQICFRTGILNIDEDMRNELMNIIEPSIKFPEENESVRTLRKIILEGLVCYSKDIELVNILGLRM